MSSTVGFTEGPTTPHTALDEMKKGVFKRTASAHRHYVSKDDPVYTPEAGRYHLYVALACPWANRCLAMLKLKGLEDAIGVSVTHATWQRTRPDVPDDTHCGWVFRGPEDAPLSSTEGRGSFTGEECIPDSINNAKCVRDLYELAGDEVHKYTVPVLWDKKTQTIVSNESSEIIRMLNAEFNDIAGRPMVDLYPEELRATIDELNGWIYPEINDGVYRSGFAQTQDAYDDAVTKLFRALDRVEDILSRQRYLCGERFTEADLRLFMTLVRFDSVYNVYFKCNCKRIDEYPNMHNYCRELYAMPFMSINLASIARHYYTSHPVLNKYSIIPRGPDVHGRLSQPHDRDRFPAAPLYPA